MATTSDVVLGVMTRLNQELLLVGQPEIGYGIGTTAREELKSHVGTGVGLIVWDDTVSDGEVSFGRAAGGNPGAIGRYTTQFEVVCWHDSRENSETLFFNLLAASKLTYDRHVVRWGKTRRPPYGRGTKGHVILADCAVELIVTNKVLPTAIDPSFPAGGVGLILPSGEQIIPDETVVPPDPPTTGFDSGFDAGYG